MLVLHTLVIQFLLKAVYGIVTNDGETMKVMIYAAATALTLAGANFAFAGNCATHSADKVKCEMNSKSWDEATSTCVDPSA